MCYNGGTFLTTGGMTLRIKDKHLQLRISDTMKKRYERALQAEGITKADHINSAIIKFVEDHEKKTQETQTAALN